MGARAFLAEKTFAGFTKGMAAHMPRVRLAGGPARVYKTRRTHLLARSNTLSVYPDSLLDSKLNVEA